MNQIAFEQLAKVPTLTLAPNWPLEQVTQLNQPTILKGLVNDWPMVKKGKQPNNPVLDYLLTFDSGCKVGAGRLPANTNGRLFYNEQLNGYNFELSTPSFEDFISKLFNASTGFDDASYYLGSTNVDKILPGLRADNDIKQLSDIKPLMSIWLSNTSRIAAHQDMAENIACCVAGKRRFTLFPPAQLENLYIGPLDFTPAGQPISLVDFYDWDEAKYPKFKQALEHAQVAELEPGDALYIPSMWWHHVESLDKVNILVNYWWQQNNKHMGAAMDVLLHGLLNIRNLPNKEKQVWQSMFDYYLFNDDDNRFSHIPSHSLGILDAHADDAARRLRSLLLNNLNR